MQCRWLFPRFPLGETTFIDITKEIPDDEKLPEADRVLILERVTNVLVEEENGKMVVSRKVKDIMSQFKKEKETRKEYEHNIFTRIRMVLEIAGKDKPIEYKDYAKAVLQQPRKGSTVMLRRDIDEIFINNYNPEFIVAWDANLDIQPVFDYYGIITYVTDYWSKDSTGLTDILKTGVKQLCKDDDMKKKCHELANVFISHRQVGEAEAYYKLLPHMNLIYSSVATVYAPTEAKDERRKFLQKQDPEERKGFKVKDKDGLYLEKPDLISKYERRKLVENNEDDYTLEHLCYSQFVKMYENAGWKTSMKDGMEEEDGADVNEEGNDIEEGELNEEDNFNFVMIGVNEGEERPARMELPNILQLDDLHSGEPPTLRKRTFPRALRFFKKNFDVSPHKFYLAELILYYPFRCEKELFPYDEEKCKELYMKNIEKIGQVKAQVMPYLQSVEEAQFYYEEGKKHEDTNIEEQVGAELDPAKEQEILDIEEEDEEEHPEYLHIDPEQIEEQPEGEVPMKKVFRAIEIPIRQVQLEEARKLDRMQSHVLSLGLRYARGLVKARKAKNKLPKAPLVMVHGGAGSGKSRVIKPLAEFMQDILQQPGDDPNCPYIVLASFTGAAAANINGQTLHSLFGFKFGAKFLSMSDKQRDEKRCQFRNLKCVIIDEISMVSSDLFYNLDLKLREIMQVDKPMGNLGVFIFGDLFQLRPPRARYVFEEPTNQEHRLVYKLRNLWEMFTVINLTENHRQGEDKTYADLLNRVRIGKFTGEDIMLLQTRVRKQDDPEVKQHYDALHIYGTNAKVNARNDAKLKESDAELYTIKATNMHRMIRNFKPLVDKAGCVKNTPFQAVLQLKKGAEIILIHNVNTIDRLTNGSRGVLVDVEKNRKDGTIRRLIIKFHNEDHGQEQRDKMPCHKYPEGTYIEPVLWQYYLGGSTATVYQFPVKMAAAITSHKIQGQTVLKPNYLVIDIETAFQAGMAYVMLSRVCSILQLFILGKLEEEKIVVCKTVLDEYKRMEEVCVNRNPTMWNNPMLQGTRVSSLNVRSLRKHIEDVRTDHVLLQSDLICLQETWMEEEEDENYYQLDGYKVHFNSQGRGKAWLCT